MELKQVRQILKALSDDTRLRIVNLLSKNQLTVNELCEILEKKQSNVSKHLSRLRLTRIVADKRIGNNVYYSLAKPAEQTRKILLALVSKSLSGLAASKKDIKKCNDLSKKGGKKI
ncbi:MAG: metalloregulator ArsR/SmtB family transcription factor [Candidatus Omnitrophota bacterium]